MDLGRVFGACIMNIKRTCCPRALWIVTSCAANKKHSGSDNKHIRNFISTSPPEFRILSTWETVREKPDASASAPNLDLFCAFCKRFRQQQAATSMWATEGVMRIHSVRHAFLASRLSISFNALILCAKNEFLASHRTAQQRLHDLHELFFQRRRF